MGNNIVLQFLARIVPVVKANSIVHHGRVVIVSPINLKKSTTVITPNGIGEVVELITDWETKKLTSIGVYLYKGFIKYFKPIQLQQYVVYHNPTEQFIRLSPQCYMYIYKNHQQIEYRVTHRLYAQMTEESKKEYNYAKSLNKQKGGSAFLKILAKQNVEIKRKTK